jgi:type VI secretion system secreted protein Hcp
MANPIHLYLKKLEGEAGKDTIGITGPWTGESRKDSIEIISLDHSVELPTDQHSGKLTGTRIHKPIRFAKEIDVASPYLNKAVCKGETIGVAEFDFYQTLQEGAGVEVLFYKIRLQKVKIVKVASKMHDIKDPANAQYKHMEEVEMRYEKITWEIVDGTHKHTDEWNER